MKVALIGASGAGKSKVGRLLAPRLGVELIDVDAVVEERAGRKISEIFAEYGEPTFRALEADATVEALSQDAVVSLGGGAPMTPKVADALRRHPHVVWLRVTPEEAADRVGHDARRPMLGDDPLAALTAMIERRTPAYAELATQTIDSAGLMPADKVELIVEALGAQE